MKEYLISSVGLKLQMAESEGVGHSPWHSDLCRTLVVPGLVISWEPVIGVLCNLFSLLTPLLSPHKRK